MFRLGVTGSIGAGKTMVARRLEYLGGELSISDDVAKDILFSEDGLKLALTQYFGNTILTASGDLDRQKLANSAFAHPEHQQFLNTLIHPLVRVRTMERMQASDQAGVELFVVDAPLIFEAGTHQILDAVLVVTAAREIRLQRVQARSGMTEEDFSRRDALQLPQAEKVRRADYVIENDGTQEELYQQVDALFNELSEGLPTNKS